MKALQFNVNVPEIFSPSGAAAHQRKLLLPGPVFHGEACRYSGTDAPVAGVGKDKDKALRGLRQRHQPHFPEGFADGITLHLLSLRAGT